MPDLQVRDGFIPYLNTRTPAAACCSGTDSRAPVRRLTYVGAACCAGVSKPAAEEVPMRRRCAWSFTMPVTRPPLTSTRSYFGVAFRRSAEEVCAFRAVAGAPARRCRLPAPWRAHWRILGGFMLVGGRSCRARLAASSALLATGPVMRPVRSARQGRRDAARLGSRNSLRRRRRAKSLRSGTSSTARDGAGPADAWAALLRLLEVHALGSTLLYFGMAGWTWSRSSG